MGARIDHIKKTTLLGAIVVFATGILTLPGGWASAEIFFILSAILGFVFLVLHLATGGVDFGSNNEPTLKW